MEETNSAGEATQPNVEEVAANEPNRDARMWAMFCHAAVLAGFYQDIHYGMFIGNIIAPLVVWFIKKDYLTFVNYNGKEVLNFQITMSVLSFGVGLLHEPWLSFAILIYNVTLTAIGAFNAGNGKYFRYPFTLRLIK